MRYFPLYRVRNSSRIFIPVRGYPSMEEAAREGQQRATLELIYVGVFRRDNTEGSSVMGMYKAISE